MTGQHAPDDLPPLVAREPDRRVPYVPTLRYPHRYCRLAHTVNAVLWLGCYGCLFLTTPELVAALSLITVCVLYLNQLNTYGRWAWIPESLVCAVPGEHEYLATTPRRARSALLWDVVFALSASTMLAARFVQMAAEASLNAWLFSVLMVLASGSWLIKLSEHDHAARILPKHHR